MLAMGREKNGERSAHPNYQELKATKAARNNNNNRKARARNNINETLKKLDEPNFTRMGL